MRAIIFSLFFCSVAVSATGQEQPDSLRAMPDTNKVQLPNVSVSFDALDNQQQTQDIAGLLQTSTDVFTSMAGFNFSAVRYRMRGYDSENFMVLMNGVPVNDPETGWAIYGMWGGLNDVTRYPEMITGTGAFAWSFGGPAGTSNMNLRPSDDRPGSRVSYAYTNRSYRHRLMATHSSGLNKKGWAYTVSLSRRWAKEGYVTGTYYDAAAYFAAVEKIINDKHSISATIFGAPTVQGRQGIAIQEAYDLTGDPYYNPFWGYQNGEKRNARVRNNHKVHSFVTHDWKPNANMSLTTTAYLFKGRTGNTNLNWYDAADPRPDYYKKFPSFFTQTDAEEADRLTQLWQANDPATAQIDFDYLYFANSKNKYALPDGSGEANRSKYIIEEYRLDPTQIGVSSMLTKKLNKHILLNAGLNAEHYTSRNFRVMKDLLGGDFWLDVDQFAEQQFEDPNASQNNLENPDAIVQEGDKFGYDYNINVNKAHTFGQLEFAYGKFDAYVGGTLSYTGFQRVGNFRNGRFPDNSFGKSPMNHFLNYGLKGGGVYKITGRHFITANALYMTRAPYAVNAFIAPRVRDAVVNNLQSNRITAVDLNYVVRYGHLKARVSGYHTKIANQNWARSFYHDEYRTFVNYTMTGLDEVHNGIEAGVAYTLFGQFTLQGALGLGDFFYTSRPLATITADNDSKTLAEDKVVYLKNYKVGGAPQSIASVGARYNSAKFWFVGVSFNYWANNWLDPNPDRRTAEALEKYVTTDPQWDQILAQEKLDNGYTIDLYAGYSYMIKRGKFLRINMNVSNLLNVQNLHAGGFEQLRYDTDNIDKFPPKYSNIFGRTGFIMLTYQF